MAKYGWYYDEKTKKYTKAKTPVVSENEEKSSPDESDWKKSLSERYARAAAKDYDAMNKNMPDYTQSFEDKRYALGGSAEIQNSGVIPKFENYSKYAPIISQNLKNGADYLGMSEEKLAEYQKNMLELAEQAIRNQRAATARTGGLASIDTTGMKKGQLKDLQLGDMLYKRDNAYEALQVETGTKQKPDLSKLYEDPNAYAEFVSTGAQMEGAKSENMFGQTLADEGTLSALLNDRSTYGDYLKMYEAYPTEALSKDLRDIQSYNTDRNVNGVTTDQYEAARARVMAATGVDYGSIAKESWGADNQWVIDALNGYRAGQEQFAQYMADSGTLGDITLDEYLKNEAGVNEYLANINRKGERLDAWEDKANSEIAKVQAQEGYSKNKTYVPNKQLLDTDNPKHWDYLEGNDDYVTEAGETLNKEQYRKLAVEETLAALVDAGKDQTKLEALYTNIQLLPELNQYGDIIKGLPYLQPRQKEAFFAEWNNGNRENAISMLYTFDYGADYARVKDEEKKAAEEYNKAGFFDKVGWNIESVGQQFISGIVGMTQAAQAVFNPDDLSKQHEYSEVYDYGRDASTIRGLTRSEIEEKTPWANIGGVNVIGSVYSGGMSGFDSMVVGAAASVFGPAAAPYIASIAMGSQTFANERMSKLEQGYSEEDADRDAFVKWAMESGSEFLPYSNMFKSSPSVWRKIIKGTVPDMLGEISSEAGQGLYDELMYGAGRAELMAKGYGLDGENLWGEWLKTQLPNYAEAAIGSLVGQGGTVVSAVTENIQDRHYAKNLIDHSGVDATMDLAETLDLSDSAKDIVKRWRAEQAEKAKGENAETAIDDTAAVTKEDAAAEARETKMAERDRGERAEETKGAIEEDAAAVTKEDADAMVRKADQIARDLNESADKGKGGKTGEEITEGGVTKADAEAAVKEMEQTARDRKEVSGKKKGKKVSNAEIGYVFREVMSNIDKGAKDVVAQTFSRDVVETELAKSGFRGDMRKAADAVTKFISGDTGRNVMKAIEGNEAMRKVALEFMEAVDIARDAYYSRASEVAKRASRDFVKPETTKAQKGAEEATEGIDDRAEVSDEDVELVMSGMPESTVDGKEVSIEDVKVGEDGGITYTVKDAEGNVSEVSEGDIQIGENDADTARLTESAKELGRNADVMLKAYNAEQNTDIVEYGRQFKQAVQYGEDGRNLDTMKDSRTFTALTDTQVELAYEVGRGMRVHRNNAMVRKNVSGIKVGQVDTSRVNMGSLTKHQRTAVHTMGRLAKAAGFNVRFVESKANAEGQYTTKNGSWDPKTLTLTLDVHAGSNKVSDVNYAMMHTAGHELTHYIRQFADTDLWNSYQEFVVGHLSKKEGEGFSIDDQINEHIEIARSEGRKLTRDKAIEEIIANASGEALNSITEADIQALAETNPSLLNKVKQFFERWIKSVKAAIKAAYSGTEAKTAEAKQMMDAVDEMGKRWNELFVNAAKNRAAETNAVNDTVKDTVSENDSPMNEAVDFVDYAWPGEVKYSPRRTKQEIANIQAIGEKSVNDFDSDDIKKTSTLAQQYFEEMGTKSPFFKAWFGDWRANDTSPVLIANTIGKERGEVSNADTGWNIQVSGKVFNETKSHNGVVNTEALPYLDYINDIVKKAVLLDTFGMRVPKSENSVLMHNMYAIADIGNGAELLKLYVEEMNDVNRNGTAKRAYQLQNIEKQPLTVKGSGKSLASAQSTAAIKSVADLHRIVKAHGELEGAKSVDAKMTNADGTPKVMYHGTPYGGFTVFKDWQYFTDNPEYANVYQEPSASSIRGRYNPATNPKTYEVYLNVKKPFDTRDPKIRKIWQEEFYNQYSRTPLSEKGLPDWTDGIDLVEFIEDNDYDFDAIILDEGATGGYGDDVQSRGVSVVVRSSNQVKSATDNIGTFDPNNPDINYQSRDLSHLSDRELLVRSLETELTPAERDHLERYKTKVDALAEKQRRLDEISGKIVEMKKAGATAKTSEELRKLETNATTLRASINRADEALNKIESAAMIKEVIRRNRAEVKKAATEAAKARADERVKRAVEKERAYSEKVTRKIRENAEKRIEAAKKSGDTKYRNLREWQEKEKYRKQVEQDTKRLYKWLTAPGKQGSVPEFLRKPVGDFIEQLDFSSVTKLKGGADTNRDIDFRNALDNLRAAISNLQSQQTDIDGGAESFYGYIDLPMHFAQRFDENVQAIKKALDVGGNRAATPIERMTAAQMKELSQAMRILSSSITHINEFITDGRGTSAKNLADVTINEMTELKARRKANKALELLNSTFNWKNTTPYYAFQRLGLGGKAIFERLQNGWDKMAFNSAKVIEYARDAFTEKESREWSREISKVKLDNGEEIQMTTAQKMSLYCLQKRPQAQGHLMGGGIRISDIDGKRGTKITQADDYTLTMDDITRITHSLTDRQREVADKLQHFMNTTCSDWGNEISMKRFGFRQMEETNYFPIETDANNRARIDETKDGKTSMFRLLNMSALKPLTPNANNAIVIKDIFNVFSDHASDMAKYNALALPILDFIKWYNHVERSDVRGDDGKANGQIKTRSVQKALEHAFGQDAKGYLTEFIRDLNGEHDGGRNDHIINRMTSLAKTASVGANMRVYGLQITSLPRALFAINAKYLIKGMASIRANGPSAQDEIGILKWKDLGFFSTDISRNVRSMVKQDEGTFEKIRNIQMKPAEWGDKFTANVIYNAVRAEMKDKHPDLRPGSADYKRVVNERVREIIYKTQVVDSTMTRSELMRKKGLMSMFTSFMSEPTLTVNMLNEAVQDAIRLKRGGKLDENDLTPGKKAAKAWTAFLACGVASTLVASVVDAFRDDDEYETWLEKYADAIKNNAIDAINIPSMLPVLADFAEAVEKLIKGQDYAPSTLGSQVLVNLVATVNGMREYFEGKRTLPNVIYSGLKTLSYGSGIGMYNATRDAIAIYNATVANGTTLPKIQSWNDNKEKAAKALYEAAQAQDIETFDKLAARAALYGIEGEDLENEYNKLINADYIAGEIDAAAAKRMIQMYGGKTPYQAQTALDKLDYQATSGEKFSDIEKNYVSGKTAKADAKAALTKYGDMTATEAEDKIKKWDYEKDTGRKYSDISNAYIRGEIKRAEIIKAMTKYGGDSAGEAEKAVLKLDYQIKTERPWSNLMKDYHAGRFTSNQVKKYLMEYDQKSESEADDLVDKYDWAKKNGGSTDGYSKYITVHEAIDSGKGLDTAVEALVAKYTARGDTKKEVLSAIRSSITSKYKPIYLAASASEQARMRKQLLDVYVKLGGNYNTYYKNMTDKWFED